MRIPLTRARGDNSPEIWWEWLFAPIIMPLILLTICVAAVGSLLVLPFFCFSLRRRERRLTRQMHGCGRFIAWENLEPRLLEGEGTLIVEQAQCESVRVWWTREDVAKASPLPVLPEVELDYMTPWQPQPFVAWCFGRYLHPEEGSALLTHPPFSYPAGFVEKAFFLEKYPILKVVSTVQITQVDGNTTLSD